MRSAPTPVSEPILVCYDRSVGSRRAIETAGAMFPGRRAIVLHVWSPAAAMTVMYGAMLPSPAYDESELQGAATKLAAEGVGLAVAAGLEATPEIASAGFDGASHTILRVAEQHAVGLIVVGARGLSVFRSFVLGSVSHGVVQHAHRPVLVVPPATRAEAPSAPSRIEDQHERGAGDILERISTTSS